MAKNYYEVLGLRQNATTRQIRERFLELARERHPDRIRGGDKSKAEEEFQEVTQAFNILSDPARRREVDAELARPDYSKASTGSTEAAKVYLQRGVRAYRARTYTEAIDNLERSVAEDPELAQAWYYLARAGSQVPSLRARAREAAVKSCELEAMNAAYLKLAAELCADQGFHAQAAKYYRGAIDWGDGDPELEKAFQASLRKAKAETP